MKSTLQFLACALLLIFLTACGGDKEPKANRGIQAGPGTLGTPNKTLRLMTWRYLPKWR